MAQDRQREYAMRSAETLDVIFTSNFFDHHLPPDESFP